MNAADVSALMRKASLCLRNGDLAGAGDLSAAALALKPDDPEALHLQGIVLLQTRRFAAAADLLARAVEIKPDDYAMRVNLGMALTMLERYNDAIAMLSTAMGLNSANPEVYLYLSRCRLGLGQLPAAETTVTMALMLRPDWPEALEVRALIAWRNNQYDAAIASAEQALAGDPARSISHVVIANVCTRVRSYDRALTHYRKALEINPENYEARSHFGLLLTRMGRHEQAVEQYRQALTLRPADLATRYSFATTLLATGRLHEGWELYRARSERPDNDIARRPYSMPLLTEPPRTGQRVLTWTDQGVGEQIMFAGLIPELAATGAELTVETDPRLAPLFARSFPGVRCQPAKALPDAAAGRDGHFSLPDASAWLRADFSKFPRHNGYLKADADRTRALREGYKKAGGGRPLVGISWRSAAQAKVSRDKTLPLSLWGPVVSVPGLTFVSLQYGENAAEVEAAQREFGIKILSEPRIDGAEDLDAFAAQVAAMDLVITTSSAAAHMAGALGIPGWVLVPLGMGGLWHWFLERDDSPWYPSLRLIRQEGLNDWDAVLEKVSPMLADFADTVRRGS